MRRSLLALIVVAVLAASGCGSSGGARSSTTDATTESSGSSSAPPSTSPATTAAAGSGTTFVGSLADEAGVHAGSTVALLAAVRVAHHPGFDRVVFEFKDGVLPDWSVRYTKGPFTEDPSGAPVAVAGSAFLEVELHGASGVDLDTGATSYTGPKVVPGGSATVVQEVARTGDFEALMGWVVGLARQVPFHVSTLLGPARVVVDVAAP